MSKSVSSGISDQVLDRCMCLKQHYGRPAERTRPPPRSFPPRHRVGLDSPRAGIHSRCPKGRGPYASAGGHPFIPNATEILSGQPMQEKSANIPPSRPTLQFPFSSLWAREGAEKLNERVLAGMRCSPNMQGCWAWVCRAFLALSGWRRSISSGRRREVLMTGPRLTISSACLSQVPHSAHGQPSWFGESVGLTKAIAGGRHRRNE